MVLKGSDLTPLVHEITATEELINGSKREITSSNILLGVATKI